MKHVMVQSSISSDIDELKTSKVNKENKQEFHIPSSETNLRINIAQRKARKKNRVCTQKTKYDHDKQMTLPIHTKTANWFSGRQLKMRQQRSCSCNTWESSSQATFRSPLWNSIFPPLQALSLSFSLSITSPLPLSVQKNIFLFMQCWYPPPVSAVVLSITPTSSLPSLPPIPSVCPEQLTHQLFFLHLQALLATQERLFLRVARKNNKNNRK